MTDYDQSGPGTPSLPPVILIPGMQCTELVFASVAEELQDRIPALHCSIKTVVHPSFEGAVEDLLASSLEPPILVGHSLGGTLAMATARMRPGSIAGVVTVCSNPRPPTKKQLAFWLEAKLLASNGGAMDHAELLIPDLLASGDPEGSARYESHAAVCREMASKIGQGLIDQLDLQIARTDERPALSTFPGPVLALAAQDDHLVSVSAAAEIAQAAPAGEFVLLKRASHMAPLASSPIVASAITSWLLRHFAS